MIVFQYQEKQISTYTNKKLMDTKMTLPKTKVIY